MAFEFKKLSIEGLLLIKPQRFGDTRGWFQETFKASAFASEGFGEDFVQDNISLSSRGTLRGLHFQNEPYAQGKLVQVLHGRGWDVAVDLRPKSPSFGKWHGLELSAAVPQLFYIPAGFAHGFVALEDNTLFSYKCTKEYNKASEGGVRWNDPEVAITWPLQDVTLSEKDGLLPLLKDVPQ